MFSFIPSVSHFYVSLFFLKSFIMLSLTSLAKVLEMKLQVESFELLAFKYTKFGNWVVCWQV